MQQVSCLFINNKNPLHFSTIFVSYSYENTFVEFSSNGNICIHSHNHTILDFIHSSDEKDVLIQHSGYKDRGTVLCLFFVHKFL